MDINKVLQTGREALLKEGIQPRETRLLLAFVMGIRSEELIKYKECSDEQYNKFLEVIDRRIAGEPYAYIVGYKEFMKLQFKVNSDVLIPREDTEILVQEIIARIPELLKNKEKIKILDMCTGSGCIAISLAKYIKDSTVMAVDISEKALKIAEGNAIINNVEIEFIESNLFERIEDRKFDVIVSNPPYIRKDVIETLQKEVQKEPMLALDGGESGLDFYKKITFRARNFLNKGGLLAFEIGFDQGKAVYEIMEENKFKDITVKKDINENDRIVLGYI